MRNGGDDGTRTRGLCRDGAEVYASTSTDEIWGTQSGATRRKGIGAILLTKSRGQPNSRSPNQPAV
jgi:hypothetical protein